MRNLTQEWRNAALATLGLMLVLFVPAMAGAQTLPPMPPQKVVSVYGQTIAYFEAGQGPNLLLLHGLGGDAGNWVLNIGPLSQSFHVYALDQVGFGHSAKPFIDYRIETFTDFLQEFMKVLNIPKATLVGNSLGGWIALDFAAHYPDHVDSLVLVDAAGLTPERLAPRPAVNLNAASLEGMRRVMEIIFYNKQIVTDEIVRHFYERHLQSGDGYTISRLLATLFAGDQFEDASLASLRMPTLVVWGREDALVPLSIGERFEKGISGARLAVIDQCGHVPQLEKPAEFNKTLQEFLARP